MSEEIFRLIMRLCLSAALVATGLYLAWLFWRTVILGNLFDTAPFNAVMVTLGLMAALAAVPYLIAKIMKGKHHA